MSIPAVAAGFRVPDLTPPRRLVVLAYAYAACEHGYTWISIPKIARRVEMDERSIRRILRHLTDRGVVDVVIEGGGNRPHLIRVLGYELADDDCEKIDEYVNRFSVPEDALPRTDGQGSTPDGGSGVPGPTSPPTPDPRVPPPRTQDPGEPKRTVNEPSSNPVDVAVLVERWATLVGIPATPTIRRRWKPRVVEFLNAAPTHLDVPAFVDYAARNGCREPGGWPYFLAAYLDRTDPPEPCALCDDKGLVYYRPDNPAVVYRWDELPGDSDLETRRCPHLAA